MSPNPMPLELAPSVTNCSGNSFGQQGCADFARIALINYNGVDGLPCLFEGWNSPLSRWNLLALTSAVHGLRPH